jgi:hypothetical protein
MLYENNHDQFGAHELYRRLVAFGKRKMFMVISLMVCIWGIRHAAARQEKSGPRPAFLGS